MLRATKDENKLTSLTSARCLCGKRCTFSTSSGKFGSGSAGTDAAVMEDSAEAPLVDPASESSAGADVGTLSLGLASSSSEEDTEVNRRMPLGTTCWLEESAESSDMLEIASSKLLSGGGECMRVSICRLACSASSEGILRVQDD